MKKMKKIALIGLALGLTLGLAATASASSSTSDTTAKIKFIDGGIVIPPDPGTVIPGMNQLLIDFGSYTVPIRPEMYRADNASSVVGHTQGTTTTPAQPGVAVSDTRAQPGNWRLTAKGSRFIDGAKNFTANLYLANGTTMTSDVGLTFPSSLYLEPAFGSGFTDRTRTTPLAEYKGVTIPCNGSNTEVTVMHATSSMSVGSGGYGVWWPADNIYLDMLTGWNNLGTGDFTSTLTWTLTY